MAEIDDWVADNYEAIVADKNRGWDWERVAIHAEKMADKALAAHARKRHAETADVTPNRAVSDKKSVRDK